MAIATRPARPDAPPAEPPARRRRRVWPILLLATMLFTLASFAAAGIGIANYEPLTRGYSYSFPGDRLPSGETPIIQTTYRHGAAYTFAFSVANRGRVAITVNRFAGLGTPLLHAEEILIGPSDPRAEMLSRTIDEARPFRPFTLSGGDQRRIWVRARFAGCDLTSAPTRLDHVDVRFEVLGQRREQSLALPVGLVVQPGACPTVRPTAVDGPLPATLVASTEPRALELRAAARELRGCAITVNGASSLDGYARHLDLIEPRRTLWLPADTFARAGGETWASSGEALRSVTVRCDGARGAFARFA